MTKKPLRRPKGIRADPKVAAAIWFYRALSFASAADACALTYGSRADLYVINFLLARAFELTLKSALSADGVSADLLASRKYGHDLAVLLRACNERSIVMIDPSIPDTAWGLRNLNDAYCTKELEYQELGRMGGPTPPLLRRLVHFAMQEAFGRALRPEVRARFLENAGREPGFTLDSLRLYDFQNANIGHVSGK